MTRSISIKNFFIVLLLLIIMLAIISNPEESMNSANEGLNIWLNLLLPSLFPFILISNLLISFGFVKFLGRFLEPIMRPIFKVSGAGIFPFLISIVSGYPVGAKLSANLRRNNLISQTEGNRLISFSSTSGPLFILGTVMIGMIKVNAAPLFLVPHYLAVITVGFFFRFYGGEKSPKRTNNKRESSSQYKSLGDAMGYAVKDSMNSMILVGGYVIIFTVIIDLVLNSPGLNSILINLSSLLNIELEVLKGLTAGVIELTNGCYIVSKLNIDILYKVLIINFLIGWGGFSINSQAISFISQTDLNTGIYLISKLFHGIFSSIYTYVIYQVFYRDRIMTVFFDFNNSLNGFPILTWLEIFKSSISITMSAIVFLVLLSIFVNEMKKRT